MAYNDVNGRILMRTWCWAFLLILLCGACGKDYDHRGKSPLVELNGKFLYWEDMQSVLPRGLSVADSLEFTNRYIRNWVEDALLFDKAESNIPNNAEIDRLVENYRKALIVHTYQQALIRQQLSQEISEDTVADYYEAHRELFRLERPLIKGLFVKVPLKAPGLSSVRRWYKTEIQEAVEHLEKYSLQHAVNYEYFRDKWLAATEILDLMPLDTEGLEQRLLRERNIELKDTAFHYLLNVTDYLHVGDQAPLEFARSQVKEILLNMKQVEFMEGVKDDLYEQAVEKDKIKYYIEH